MTASVRARYSSHSARAGKQRCKRALKGAKKRLTSSSRKRFISASEKFNFRRRAFSSIVRPDTSAFVRPNLLLTMLLMTVRTTGLSPSSPGTPKRDMSNVYALFVWNGMEEWWLFQIQIIHYLNCFAQIGLFNCSHHMPLKY